MLFNSLEFALYFPIVCALYFLVPRKLKTPLLLVASCGFYMAFIPAYILILFTTILVDYFAGMWIENSAGPRKKRLLWISITATCLILFVFKYFYFFTDTFAMISSEAGLPVWEPAIRIILPIGLSFHTFQSLSYVIEVYRGAQKAERDFITYATYVMFFPQLVAGPIERPQNLLHQFHEVHAFDHDRVVSGLRRMAWGFFKKLVVADRLALYVNDVYGAPHHHNGLQLSIATVFFAYQIYCDFSGYSDIAIGTARVLGFRLMENFDRPYQSSSISEFWRRWHISLSTWFRDYVYFPLGGSKVARPKWVRNILITFGVSGLWHGAAWTYVAWGVLNGIYLVFGGLTKGIRDRIMGALGVGETTIARRFLMWLTTFLLIGVTWILFRATTFSDAWYILTHLHSGWDFGAIKTQHFQLKHFPAAILGIALLEGLQYAEGRWRISGRLVALPSLARWPAYASIIFFVVLFGVYQSTQFIYFQF